MARQGQLGDSVVAVGPWWRADGGDEIDAVVMAEPDRTRVPVAIGEAKWSRRVDAARVGKRLAAKAASLAQQLGAGAVDPADLRYVICAREEVARADPDTLTVTAADIFAPP